MREMFVAFLNFYSLIHKKSCIAISQTKCQFYEKL